MDRGTGTPKAAARLPSGDEKNNKLLMQAVMLSEGAQAELRRARKARADAEQIREKAEADRLQAHKERECAEALRESAEALKEETKRICAQMEVESKERAEQVINEERIRVRTQIAEMELQAEEEMRTMLADIKALQTAAQEEVNAQRLLTGAARLRAGSSYLNLLDELASGAAGQSDEDEASGSSQAGATDNGEQRAEPGIVDPEPQTPDPAPAASNPDVLAELAVAGSGNPNGHVQHEPRPTKRAARRGGGNGTKKRA